MSSNKAAQCIWLGFTKIGNQKCVKVIAFILKKSQQQFPIRSWQHCLSPSETFVSNNKNNCHKSTGLLWAYSSDQLVKFTTRFSPAAHSGSRSGWGMFLVANMCTIYLSFLSSSVDGFLREGRPETHQGKNQFRHFCYTDDFPKKDDIIFAALKY